MSTNRVSSASLIVLLLTLGAGCAGSAESPSEESPTEGAARESEGAEIGQAKSALRASGGLSADGDSCTVRTNPDGTTVPGTVSGLECCATADSKDCVIILKPFPGVFRR